MSIINILQNCAEVKHSMGMATLCCIPALRLKRIKWLTIPLLLLPGYKQYFQGCWHYPKSISQNHAGNIGTLCYTGCHQSASRNLMGIQLLHPLSFGNASIIQKAHNFILYFRGEYMA